MHPFVRGRGTGAEVPLPLTRCVVGADGRDIVG